MRLGKFYLNKDLSVKENKNGGCGCDNEHKVKNCSIITIIIINIILILKF